MVRVKQQRGIGLAVEEWTKDGNGLIEGLAHLSALGNIGHQAAPDHSIKSQSATVPRKRSGRRR